VAGSILGGMNDLVAVALTLAFFVVAALYARFCAKVR